jgi:hypothetical protein
MPTSKELRAPPTQDFDKYTLTRVVGPEAKLFPIASSAMWKFSGDASSSFTDEGLSPTTSIGFDFRFNEKTYDRFVASTNGYVVLREKNDVGTFVEDDYVIPEVLYINDRFETDGVLLCPWMDNLRNAYSVLKTLPLTNDEKLRISQGIDLPPVAYNQVTSALKYINTIDPSGRRCLVIRWRSFSNSGGDIYASSIILFEVVIYESGRIEFRYDTKKTINSFGSNAIEEGATIGVFVNDSPDTLGWRFRDFSKGLGHPSDENRPPYKYGGYEYDSTYTDTNSVTTLPYNFTLFVSNVDPGTSPPPPAVLKGRIANWPGQDLFGCVMTFAPPVNRRKVLPRKDLIKFDSKRTYPLTARTGDVQRMGTYLGAYDDRRSLVYGTPRVADYPTTLPRDYADTEAGAPDRQNLFGDFEATSSVSKSIADPFIGNVPVEYVKPFVDHNRPEQDPNAGLEEYYLTGSSIELFGDSLLLSLKSKTQLKLELPIQHQLQMLETGSAIYYYNQKVKGMFVPQSGNARKDIMNATASVMYQTEGVYWPEDARGFGPVGNVVASGSNPDPLVPYWSSDPEFGHDSGFWFENTASMNLLTRTYEKNVQINPDYVAGNDEQISVPINQPFILEKAVFEIPFSFGQGWFEDRTTSSTPIGVCSAGTADKSISTETFDFAGPAITVSLFNQISNGHTTHRDLILTGTIIPVGDNSGNVAVRQSWIRDSSSNIYPIWLFEPEGFVKYDSTPSAVIHPDENNMFTGSVRVQTIAGISNGVVLRQEMRATAFADPSSPYMDDRAEFIKSFMTSPDIGIYSPAVGGSGKGFVGVSNVKSVNPFSRDSRGNNVSGRSVFGKEHITYQTAKNGRVSNPLFVSSSFDDFPVALKSVLDVSINTEFQSFFQYAIPVDKSIPSPYLLLPGDKLVFGISKNRPTLHTNEHFPISDVPVDFWRQGLRHDAWVNTGSIKITLYGSLLREGKEFHDPLNQSLDSNFVHETIGMEPVCDQFQVEYDDSFYGTYTDGYITGSIFPVTAKSVEFSVNGSSVSKTSYNTNLGPTRGSLFSRVDARSATYNQTDEDYLLNNSKSARLQPLHERVGTQRFLRISSNFERFYDSIMPDFNECILANGTSIHHLGYPEQIFQSNTGSFDRDKTYGVVFLSSEAIETNFETMNDNSWGPSYPFESRYTGVQRRQYTDYKSVTTLSASIDPVDSITVKHKRIDKLLICQRDGDQFINVMCDVDLTKTVEQVPFASNYYVTSSMSHEDMTKVLYGIGDGRVAFPTVYEDYRVGYNQQPLFREEHTTVPPTGPIIKFQYGPIIRGWKFGVFSGLPAYSSTIFNRNRFGQMRDMLEQRLDTRFYLENLTDDGRNAGAKNSTGTGPVHIRFINTSTGGPTTPSNTSSSNLSHEAAATRPYFDGVFTNREDNFESINYTMVELST